ncbi:hypothetical protein B0H21DRAFT_754533 [Amylocystis lapponica]|nr:hypothetical protein B0H21DRAFT_754533 [Amylocystis lapponica]
MVSIHNGWFSIPIMCGFIAAVVQIFFSWRIYKLARSRIVAGVIVLCSVGQFSVAVLSGVLMLRDVPSAVVASRVTLMLSAWLIASAIVDVLIAIVMTTFLIKVKTSLAPADDLVNRLIRLVIETGTLTATIAIIDVVLFYTTPTNSLVYECPLFILSKLYANTLLVNLNNRAFMRRGQMVIDTSVNNSVFGPRSNIDFRHPQDVESVPEPRCQCMAQVDVLRESDLSRVSPENPQRRTYGDSRALIGNDDLEDEKTDSAALVQ